MEHRGRALSLKVIQSAVVLALAAVATVTTIPFSVKLSERGSFPDRETDKWTHTHTHTHTRTHTRTRTRTQIQRQPYKKYTLNTARENKHTHRHTLKQRHKQTGTETAIQKTQPTHIHKHTRTHRAS